MSAVIAVRRTLKYRLYRKEANKHLVNAIDIAGIIWNHALALCKRYYRRFGKGVDFVKLQTHLAKLRRRTERYAFWQKLGSQAVQDVAQRLQRAYERFFAKRGGYPRFKKVKQYKSFTLKQSGWKLLGGNRVEILKRSYKVVLSRPIEGKVKTVTVKRDSLNRLWLCFSVIVDVQAPELSTGETGGFDFGLKHFLTTDTGERIASPQFFKQAKREIAALNRELSRQQNGSNNRARTKYRLAKAHDDIANKRHDGFYKLAHALCDRYAVMCVEDLNLRGMQRLWGRKVSDLAFGEFLGILAHVASKRGCTLVKVDRWEPTSQTCSDCGTKQKLDLRERVFACVCGLVIDRDQNAAINIKRVGASTHDRGVVRRVEAQAEARNPA